jgi:uncharacterized membrane-anchored protein
MLSRYKKLFWPVSIWPLSIERPWLFWLGVVLLCVGGLTRSAHLIDTYHDDVNAVSTIIIALFTAVLGVFTIRLAKSTRIAADAAKLNAEALMTAEGAHLYPIIRE